MNLNQILLLFSFFGAIQGMLIAGMLSWQSKWRSLELLLLSLLFLGASTVVVLISMVNSGLVIEQPVLVALEGLINLSVGVIFLHYLILALRIPWGTRWILVFYLPAALYLLYVIIPFQNRSILFLPERTLLIYFQSSILLAAYLYFKFGKGRKTKSFDWPGLLLALFLIVVISQWLRYFLPNRLPYKMIIPFILTLGFWSITLYGFLKSVSKGAAYRKPVKLAAKPQPELLQRIRHIVENEKIYLDPNLTQYQLASRLEVHPNQLSIVFKDHFQSSFSQYINQYRINKAKALLEDPAFDHLSVEGIGLEAGFKSRSVFYRVFKELVGKTPATFRTNANSK